MIGKVLVDSFQGLGIRTSDYESGFEPSLSSLSSPSSPRDSFLFKDCSVGSGRPSPSIQSLPERALSPQLQQPSTRYKTEMCRPFQEHGVCKYGEKCQFAHGTGELRTVNRHPKYKTDMCRTYHSVGFCPYGPRCHFIHSLEEMRSAPASPDKKSGSVGNGGGPIKQLPMFGGGNQQQEDIWSCDGSANSGGDSNMKSAVAQLNSFFNMAGTGGGSSGGRSGLLSSMDSSRSGSFCSDIMESHSPASGSPPPSAHSSLCTSPIDVSRSLRLPIFNRLA